MAFQDAWAHANARKLMDLFRAAVLLENGLEEGGIPDPEEADRLRVLLGEVRRLGANGRQQILRVGPGDRSVAVIVDEMKRLIGEAADIFGGRHDDPIR